MSATGLRSFDDTIHTTNAWLNDVMDAMGWEDRHKAYAALRAVLHALRDRLTVTEAAHLAAQMPMLVRGFYYEGYRPGAVPSKDRTRDDFLAHIQSEGFAKDLSIDIEKVTRAVIGVLEKRISDGEMEDVFRAMPEDIRTLWPD